MRRDNIGKINWGMSQNVSNDRKKAGDLILEAGGVAEVGTAADMDQSCGLRSLISWWCIGKTGKRIVPAR